MESSRESYTSVTQIKKELKEEEHRRLLSSYYTAVP